MSNTKKSTSTRKRSSSGRRKSTNKKGEPFLKVFLRKFAHWIKEEKTHRLFGFAILLFTIYLCIAFISYLYAWGPDQSYVKDVPWWDFLFNNKVKTGNALGRLGTLLSHLFIYKWFGLASLVVIITLALLGIKLMFKNAKINMTKVLQRSFLATILLSPMLSFFFNGWNYTFPFGGGFGNYVASWLTRFMGFVGTGLLLIFCFALVLMYIFNVHLDWDALGERFKYWFRGDEDALATAGGENKNKKRHYFRMDTNENPVVATDKNKLNVSQEQGVNGSGQHSLQDKNQSSSDMPVQEEQQTNLNFQQEKNKAAKRKGNAPPDELILETTPLDRHVLEIEKGNDDKRYDVKNLEYDPTLDLAEYVFPNVELLNPYGRDLMGEEKLAVSREELEQNKEMITETLGHYNIAIDKITATPGPTVTLYQIVPAAGVRISKIRNLEDDIALSLAALGIRIIAPMPGKGTVGIEVPNQTKQIVSLRSLILSDKFQKAKMGLPIALGKTIADENFIADLSKMPHLLLAGATGQGKSVSLNCTLISLLYKKHPSELKFVMIDPKKVELSLYNLIENHYLAKLPSEDEPIVTDTRLAVNTLNALCIEMDHRYDLLKKAHVRNIREYNHKFRQRKLNPLKGHRFLPYIVLVIDEFADLIMTAGKEIEMPLARLAQLARAIGIHLIIATQRPTVNIITGTIKANFPVRIAFRVTSKVDSRTILDTGGANQLIGKGDLLLSMGADLIRLQGAFVDTEEVERIAEFISEQRGYPEAFLLPEFRDGEEDSGSGSGNKIEWDEMFEEAAHVIVQHQQGSTSLIQRRLRLGYNRAGRIMDQLEATGIVGPSKGSKARDVLIMDILELEEKLQRLKGG